MEQLWGGCNRMASLMCLMIHGLATGVTEVIQPNVSHHQRKQHKFVLVEHGCVLGERRDKRGHLERMLRTSTLSYSACVSGKGKLQGGPGSGDGATETES